MPLSIIHTPVLQTACLIDGPDDGEPLFLLHGWPDCAETWTALLPALHRAGWKTICPFLRGFGPTRFHRPDQPRTGQIAALAVDLLELADALQLSHFAVIGHDWGARAAYSAAVLAPERIRACVALSAGWAGNDPHQSLPLRQAQYFWYHWLMALDRGETLIRQEGLTFARYLWRDWSPGWIIPDEDFAIVASSLGNPDWADVTLHSYRVRWGYAPQDPAYAAVEAKIAAAPQISSPTLVLHGDADPCNAPETSAGRESFFTGSYQRLLLAGAGHFPQRQSPEELLRHLLPFLEKYARSTT